MERKKIIIGAIIISCSMMLSSFGFYFWQMIYTPNILVEKKARALMIPTGSTFKEVQTQLFDGGYVHDLVSFSFLAKMMKYDQSVKPGLYWMNSNLSNLDAIRILRSGEQHPVNITFNNVRLLPDLGKKITRNLEMSAAQFSQIVMNKDVQASFGFDSLTMISMFIPNTYQVFWNISPLDLLKRIKNEYDKFWSPARLAQAHSIQLTPTEVATLASIVQAETIKADELKVVAGLYLNRIRRGYRLQADPTLVFATQDFTIQRVLNIHKSIRSPFNTYLHLGLPPGPINMPSISSLDAVLYAATHHYLYMCAKEDFSGYHNFATNLIDHNRNAAIYQRTLNKARLYK